MKSLKHLGIINWVELKKIPDLKLVNTMYIWIFIVPLLSNFFQYVSKEENGKVNLLFLGNTFQINLELPFTWYLFYFAALFFAFGTLLFKFSCPKLIQDHFDFASFQQSEKTREHLQTYFKLEKIEYKIIEDQIRGVREWKNTHNEINDDIEKTLNPKSRIPKEINSINSEIFWAGHGIFKTLKKIRFRLCLWSFIIGFGLLTIVLIENFISVLKLIF